MVRQTADTLRRIEAKRKEIAYREAQEAEQAEAKKRAEERAARVDAERAARSKRQRSQSEELAARTGAMGGLNPDAVRRETAMKEAAMNAARIRNGNSMARMNANDFTQDTGGGGTVKTYDPEGNQIPVSQDILTDFVTVKSRVGQNVWSDGQGLLRPEDGTPENRPGGLGFNVGQRIAGLAAADSQGQATASSQAFDRTNERFSAEQVAGWDIERDTVTELAKAAGVETKRKNEIYSSLAILEETLANFRQDSLDAEKYGGEESVKLFHQGHQDRLRRREDLKAELETFATDGIMPSQELQILFQEAGINPSGMDDWDQEQMDYAVNFASGVATGNIPHPDEEEKEWKPATGGSGADARTVNTITNLIGQPTESGVRKLVSEEWRGADGEIIPEEEGGGLRFAPNYDEFVDSDYADYFGEALRYTALMKSPDWKEGGDPNKQYWSVMDYIEDQNGGDTDKETRAATRATVITEIGAYMERTSGQDLSTWGGYGGYWLGDQAAVVYDRVTRPATPSSDSAYQAKKQETVEVFRRTYPQALSQVLFLEGETSEETIDE